MATADRVVWASESSSVVVEQRRVGPADQKQIFEEEVSKSGRGSFASYHGSYGRPSASTSKKGRVSM